MDVFVFPVVEVDRHGDYTYGTPALLERPAIRWGTASPNAEYDPNTTESVSITIKGRPPVEVKVGDKIAVGAAVGRVRGVEIYEHPRLKKLLGYTFDVKIEGQK